MVLANEENKMLTCFHYLAQARRYADTKGQKLITCEMKRIRKKYKENKWYVAKTTQKQFEV